MDPSERLNCKQLLEHPYFDRHLEAGAAEKKKPVKSNSRNNRPVVLNATHNALVGHRYFAGSFRTRPA